MTILIVFSSFSALTLLDTTKELESVTKKLQDPKLTMSDVRVLFDFVIEHFPGMSHYLSADAEIIQDPILERAIVKIQDGQQLTAEEIVHAQYFELPATAIATAEVNAQEESESFAELALKRRRVAAPASASSHRGAGGGQAGRSGGRRQCDVPVQPQYQPLHFIPPTSNICERFFSLAKLVYSDLRKAMKRTTLEMLLFLHLNRHLWDMEMVQKVVRDKCDDADFDNVSDEE